MALNGHGAVVKTCPLSGQSGKHLLAVSISGFDPKRTGWASNRGNRINSVSQEL